MLRKHCLLNKIKFLFYQRKKCPHMKHEQLDHIDLKIIQILQENARTAVKDIAKAVFLSSPAVSARIRRLVDAGFITGFHAAVDNEKPSILISASRTASSNATVSPVIIPCCWRSCSQAPPGSINSSGNCSSSAKPKH